MTLSELKTGMRVIVRNGNEYIVMRNCYVDIFNDTVNAMVNIHKSDSWLSLDKDYDDETMTCNCSMFDIMQVYTPENIDAILSKVKVKNGNALWFNNIWVRKE